MSSRKTAYNELNFKEVHEIPPPINLDVTGREKPSRSDEKLPSYALRLIRRLLTIVDADFTNISFQDREWLEDVLNGTSFSKIARSANVSVSSVRNHVLSALELLSQKVEEWENSQKEHSERTAREKQLESEVELKDERISNLYDHTRSLEAENKRLMSLLEDSPNRQEKSDNYVVIDEKTNMILKKRLSEIGLPPHICVKLKNHNIHIVSELIRHTEQQISSFDEISAHAVDLIKNVLRHHNLYLGSDIRWSPEKKDYCIYSETKDIKVNPVVSRLIWSLLDAVFSNEDDALSFKDKMLLEDILRFGTIAEVAKQRGAKSNILTYEFNQALSRLRTKIDTIEKYTAQLKQQRDGNQIIPTQNPKIEQLREENFDLKAKIAVLEHQLSQLKETK